MIAYFNCTSGISGDMFLGALVDAGVPLEKLKKELFKLQIREYELTARKVKRAGLNATKVDVVIKRSAIGRDRLVPSGQRSARKYKDIEKIIRTSTLSEEIRKKGLHIFRRLFEAEAKVHGEKFQDVHLHELGAVDCVVDIFGTLIGLDLLGIDTIYSSPLNVGSGTIKTEHGTLPVPAPATVELLKDVPVYSSDVRFELTTPTGVALISSLAKGFGPLPNINIIKTGTGAGGKDIKEQPNVLVVVIGENTEHRTQNTDKKVTVIETNIDDMNPQVYEYVMEELFKFGALDVFLTQIIMKKGRPGIKLSVLCNQNDRDGLIDIILNETTSIGVRFYQAERKILQREIRSIGTKYGKVNFKISQLNRKKQKTSVEYEDCRNIAKKFKIPLVKLIGKVRKNDGVE